MSQETLKTRYAKRINEQLELRQLLSETKHASLLIEAMTDQDLSKASEIINKFQAMKGKGLKSLDAAMDQSTTQINKYTAGGPLTAGWTKMKGVLGFDNPFVKFMTFASSLEAGFKQLPTILKNNLAGIDLKANEDKSLNELVTDEQKKKVLLSNLLKALSPKGFLGAFKKIPYVDKNAFVQDIMSVPIKNLNVIMQQASTGPNTDQIAADIQDTAKASAGVAAKQPTPGQPAKGTAGTGPATVATAAGKASPSTPAGDTPPRPAQAVAPQVNKAWT